MNLLVSKFLYPVYIPDLEKVLSPFKNLKIQLAFFKKEDFFKFNHKDIVEICNCLNIRVSTIHAPCVDVFDRDFLEILKIIKEIYRINLLTIHPQKGDCKTALEKLTELSSVIEEMNMVLAYENFPKDALKRKWIALAGDMYKKFNLPFLKITFDTAHLDEPKDCMDELENIFDKTAVIHLSDKNLKHRHLPLGEGILPYKELLDYLKRKNYSGFLVLEYLDEFQDRLIEDFKIISRILEC